MTNPGPIWPKSTEIHFCGKRRLLQFRSHCRGARRSLFVARLICRRGSEPRCGTCKLNGSYYFREALRGVAQADKNGDRRVRLPDSLYRL